MAQVEGSGTTLPLSENEALKVGGVVPPTMSVPTRSQSGAMPPSLSSRVHVCRSPVKGPVPPEIGFAADSHRKVPSANSTCGTKK